MRLYSKLLAMILVFGGIQHFAPPSAWGGEAWFEFRCHAASMLGDDRLARQLVEEYYRQNRTPDDDARDGIAKELYLASGAEAGEDDVVTGDNASAVDIGAGDTRVARLMP